MKLSDTPTNISSPALFLIGLITGITIIFSPDGGDRVWLAGMALTVWLLALLDRYRVGKGVLSGIVGLATAWLLLLWHPGTLVPFPDETIGWRTVQMEARLVDREDRPDNVRLLLDQVWLPEVDWRADGLVQVTINRYPVSAMPGDSVAFPVRLRTPFNNRNPGGFDYGAYLRGRGIVATGYGSKKPVFPLERPQMRSERPTGVGIGGGNESPTGSLEFSPNPVGGWRRRCWLVNGGVWT